MTGTGTVYEVGASGRGVCLSCGSVGDIVGVAPGMPPGRYWITATEHGRSVDGTAWLEAEDWGTITVETPDRWRVESLDGFRAGPGYIIV